MYNSLSLSLKYYYYLINCCIVDLNHSKSCCFIFINFLTFRSGLDLMLIKLKKLNVDANNNLMDSSGWKDQH